MEWEEEVVYRGFNALTWISKGKVERLHGQVTEVRTIKWRPIPVSRGECLRRGFTYRIKLLKTGLPKRGSIHGENGNDLSVLFHCWDSDSRTQMAAGCEVRAS